ncbi:DNA-binding protein H-NS [Paraburkholderia sp. BL8N3]|nr:H-NS histone family protein [Paraburkholderia sp. BL8N3]TCK36700.1 DNA-binding protein H-NS [Paraburkholderia sp. BL8N3]
MAAMNLTQRLSDLNAQIAHEQARFKAAVAAAINEVLADYELSLADLESVAPTKASKGTRKRKPPFKGVQPAKYKNPTTGATWSGFGRPPAWIDGKKREKFLIAS